MVSVDIVDMEETNTMDVLDERLEGILEKHNILHFPSVAEIVSLINRIFSEIDKDKTVSIRGAGKHTEKLLEILSDENKAGIACISADRADVRQLYGIEVISSKDVKADTDVIVISSFLYRDDMKKDILQNYSGAEIIDIYDLLSCYGMKMEYEFWRYMSLDVRVGCSRYTMIDEYKKRYMDENKPDLRGEDLRRIIGGYIDIRDFESFFQYTDIYVGERFEGWQEYAGCAEEIRQLLSDISEEIRNNPYHNIIINWIDALRYDELPDMPKLMKEIEKSAFFENSYTVMSQTAVTLQMMMRNEYVVEAKLYRKEKVNEDNSLLLKVLKDNNYSFCYIGLDKYNQWFPEEARCDEEFLHMPCAPYIQWVAMKKLYRAEGKACLILHYIAETHTPFWSGYAAEAIGDNMNHSIMMKDVKKDIPLCRQWKESRAYMDDRLDDFLEYIGRDTGKNTMIYLSDHGKFPDSGRTADRGNMHICLAVISPYIESGRIKEVFSLVNFVKIIEQIIEGEKRKTKTFFSSEIFSEYSLIQIVDPYDGVGGKVRLDFFKKINNLKRLKESMQCRGLFTASELFIRYPDGDMRYYLRSDENTNCIDDEEFRERINELKSIEMAPFINPYEDDDFAASRIIYDYLDKHLGEGNEVAQNE